MAPKEDAMSFISRNAFMRSNRATLASRVTPLSWTPVSLLETASGIEIETEIPDCDRDQVEVALSDSEITIRCRHDLSRRAFVRHSAGQPAEKITENVYDAVAQSIRLPFPVARQASTVSFIDGRLRILAPRRPASGGGTRIRYGDAVR
jgi:HSP20 family molecular chaperone IbpA